LPDIDECADPSTNSCERICINIPGSYNCSCPDGYTDDGKNDGRGCIAPYSEFPWIKFSLGKYILENFHNKRYPFYMMLFDWT